MCLQCTAQSVKIVEDVIPGYSLCLATVDTDEWKAGQYGLVESNDPTVIFDGPLERDTTAGMTDDEINALPDEQNSMLDAFLTAGERFEEQLEMDPNSGYRLVCACIEAGYRPKEDGRVAHWLMHHMATKAAAVASLLENN